MGMIVSILHLYGCSVFSYQRRFPVVYLTIKVMLRPRFVNEQHEVCAFCVSICNKKIKQLIKITCLCRKSPFI